MQNGDASPAPAEKEILYFGGVVGTREPKKEETEPMRVASRINAALAMRRLPKPAQEPLAIAETAWYDELGVSPRATGEELRLKYLQHATELENRLTYLLEAGPLENEDDRRLEAPDIDTDPNAETDEDYFDEDAVTNDDDAAAEAKAYAALAKSGEGAIEDVDDEAVELMTPGASAIDAPDDGQMSEANELALNFVRISNLYQILSVPQLRRIYDQGGVELLSQRCPRLHHGLLAPERVLKLAQGMKESPETKESLLLRKVPRSDKFSNYQAANSIRQVLRRLTDVSRVWYFKSGASLAYREGTIYTELPEVACFGRVNCGKSSFLQHFLSAGKMRRKHYADAAQTPGKTTGIDVFCVNKRFTIADTPGYSYVPKSGSEHAIVNEIAENWEAKFKPLVKEYLDTTPWLRAAIYVHEISKDVTPADKEMVRMLKKRGIPVLLVLSKDDKVDSDTHRLSRVRRIRSELKWPEKWPHAYYCTRRGGYGRVFKNMLGTMLFGLLATETRDDAHDVLTKELPGVFHDYRDKYVPRPRGPFGKLPKERKFRTYPKEDQVYTDEDLESEERFAERQERRARKEEKKARGEKWTIEDTMELETGPSLSPRDRRKRWEALLEEVGGS